MFVTRRDELLFKRALSKKRANFFLKYLQHEVHDTRDSAVQIDLSLFCAFAAANPIAHSVHRVPFERRSQRKIHIWMRKSRPCRTLQGREEAQRARLQPRLPTRSTIVDRALNRALSYPASGSRLSESNKTLPSTSPVSLFFQYRFARPLCFLFVGRSVARSLSVPPFLHPSILHPGIRRIVREPNGSIRVGRYAAEQIYSRVNVKLFPITLFLRLDRMRTLALCGSLRVAVTEN